MKVIGHRNRSNCAPICVCATECLDCPKRCRICKNGAAIFDAHRNEVSDDLVMFKPDRDSRWTRHSFDCRAAILAANPKETAAKIAALQFSWRVIVTQNSERDRNNARGLVVQYPRAFFRSTAVGRGSLRIVIASVPESFSCLD